MIFHRMSSVFLYKRQKFSSAFLFCSLAAEWRIILRVQIGKNTAISGLTTREDYVDNILESGGTLIKAGDRS